jgi:tRNA(Ile)-lysidine synthase
MAARHARYRFLSRTARVVRADAIATAHTADDQAETVLLRLTRGAGTQGLAGIPWVGEQHGVRIVRPMLGVTRAEVVAFLRRSNMEWREDETKCDTFCRRNLVRAEVIPLIEKRINPRVRDALRRTADIVRAEDDWMQALARTALARWRLPDRSLDAAGLRRMPVAAARRVVRLWLTDAGVPVEHVDYSLVERVIELARTGGSIPVGPDLRVASRKKRIIAERITPATEHAFSPSKLRTPGVTMPPGAGFRITAALAPGVIKDRAARVGVLPARASLNGDVLGRRSLSVRAWRAGDRILPMGMQGSRKLQDVFVDAKFPPSRRRSWPLVLCGREVVWVPGYRVARGWEVLPGTRRIIRLIVEELRGHRVR